MRVFGTGGASAVTHRAVAKLAHVPLGSTTYYFTDRDDLLLQTMAAARAAEAIRLAASVDALDEVLTVDRVLPPSDPHLPRATVVEIVACLVDGPMLETVPNGQWTVADNHDRDAVSDVVRAHNAEQIARRLFES